MATAVNKTLSTESSESGDERIHLAVLSTLGVDLPETAKILDFGCGFRRFGSPKEQDHRNLVFPAYLPSPRRDTRRATTELLFHRRNGGSVVIHPD